MKTSERTAWDAALFILETLRQAGHVALLAGGCVRDRLLKVAPKDYDVATDAAPVRLQELFPRARHVGAKFGVILVRKFGHDVEVATFRADGPYSDGRHPDAVVFGTDREDALRRDFTINGLFLDPVEDRVIDYVEGQRDLKSQVVRTIGDPERRFAEDHLRMMRAVRFSARLGFRIEQDTFGAIVRHASKLSTISAERVYQELEMILAHATRAAGWSLLFDTGLRTHLAPGWSVLDGERELTLRRLSAFPAEDLDPALVMAAVVCDHPMAEVRTICRGLRLSNQLTSQIRFLLESLPLCRRAESMELADLKAMMAQPPWESLKALFHADLVARSEPLDAHLRLCRRAGAVSPEFVSPPPLLTGDDLSAMGMSPGPRMGKILSALYRAQQNERIQTITEARAMAQRLIAEP